MNLPSIPLNPWLEEQVKRLRSARTDDELRPFYMVYAPFGKNMSWSDFLMIRALEESLFSIPFLQTHRRSMDLPKEVKEWLYVNNVDMACDLIQITEEELRVLSRGENGIFEQITEYLSKQGISLLHCPRRTYKIHSYSIGIWRNYLKPETWTIKPKGTPAAFNLSRPTLYPVWFDQYYKQYEYLEDEEKLCKKDILMKAGIDDGEIPYNIKEFFWSTNGLWDAYRKVCKSLHIRQVIPSPFIPKDYDDFKNLTPYFFLKLRRKSVKALISVLETPDALYNSHPAEYLSANNEFKLDISQSQRVEGMQNLLLNHVASSIDFENVLYFLREDFFPALNRL